MLLFVLVQKLNFKILSHSSPLLFHQPTTHSLNHLKTMSNLNNTNNTNTPVTTHHGAVDGAALGAGKLILFFFVFVVVVDF